MSDGGHRATDTPAVAAAAAAPVAGTSTPEHASWPAPTLQSPSLPDLHQHNSNHPGNSDRRYSSVPMSLVASLPLPPATSPARTHTPFEEESVTDAVLQEEEEAEEVHADPETVDRDEVMLPDDTSDRRSSAGSWTELAYLAPAMGDGPPLRLPMADTLVTRAGPMRLPAVEFPSTPAVVERQEEPLPPLPEKPTGSRASSGGGPVRLSPVESLPEPPSPAPVQAPAELEETIPELPGKPMIVTPPRINTPTPTREEQEQLRPISMAPSLPPKPDHLPPKPVHLPPKPDSLPPKPELLPPSPSPMLRTASAPARAPDATSNADDEDVRRVIESRIVALQSALSSMGPVPSAKPLPRLPDRPPSFLPPKPVSVSSSAAPPALPPKSNANGSTRRVSVAPNLERVAIQLEQWAPGKRSPNAQAQGLPSPPVTTSGQMSAHHLPVPQKRVRSYSSDSMEPPASPQVPMTPTSADAHAPPASAAPSASFSSKRSKRQTVTHATLIPLKQLPMYLVPPLPEINRDLEQQVFSHSSLFEQSSKGVFEESDEQPARHYEKLEHVGDSILGMIVTTWLHELMPNLTCGTATKLKAHLVSNTTLAHISIMYALPQRLAADPKLLPLLRTQTEVRAALVEAYIAAVYFSFPVEMRMTEGMPYVTQWLRALFEPLYKFFLNHMRESYQRHHAAINIGPTGIVEGARSSAELATLDARAEGMALLLKMYGTQRSHAVEFEAERFETSVGILWQFTCLVDDVVLGIATRAIKYKAKNAAAWAAVERLGIQDGELAQGQQ